MFTREGIDRSHEFPGHMCPGLAVRIRAAEVALETRFRLFGGQPHCPPCFDQRDRR